MTHSNSRQYNTLLIMSFFFIIVSVGLISSSQAKDFLSKPDNKPAKIQIAILLDTSSSMDGLIDQARNQLWQAVNEFGHAKRNGQQATLEVAIYEYGNNNLPAQSGYIRQVTGFTSELDRASEALFSLTTNGGQEYCGQAILHAITSLQWSRNHNDIKSLFIAGNESFRQGPVSYENVINAAESNNITINTIHTGSHAQGVKSGWQDGARLAGGHYMSIDHNQQIAHVVTPQDTEIAKLNKQLNATYIPYGDEGQQSLDRQLQQDENSASISLGLLSERIKAKASSIYKNIAWDLVDAFESGELDLDSIDKQALPSSMQAMAANEQVAYLQQQSIARKDIQSKIAHLNKAREHFISEAKQNSAVAEAPTLNDALSTAIKQQGVKKNFTFSTQ